MISWLQNKLQKHLLLVFIIFAVLIIAFIVQIGNQGPIGGGKEATADLFFYDSPMNTEAARVEILRDAQLSASLSRNPRASQNLPYERATARYIANQNLIPEPTEDQLLEYIKTLPAFQNQLGQFDAQAYNMILDSISLGGAYSKNDLHRVLVDDYRIAKVYTALEGAGFVNESEILDSLSQRLAKWSILVAESDLNTYAPEVEITEEMLRKHYEDFSFQYQTPERRVVNYIEVEAADYVDEIKPSEDELITYFESNIDRYQAEPSEDPDAEPAEPITFEQARLAVREDLRIEKARELAAERAYDLVVQIHENDFSRESQGLKDAIAELNLELKTASSFAANETPIGTTWGRNMVNEAFSLSESRFYSEPLQHGNKSIVLFYDDVIEPTIPSFETLRQRITADVRAEKLREARAAHALELQEKLAAAADSEDSFGAAAEEAGLTVSSYSDFTLSEPAEGLDRRALSALLELESGEVSDFVRLNGDNQGAYLYVLSKEIPEVDKEDPQYAQVAQSLKNLSNQFSAQQYISTLTIQEQNRLGFAQ
ncbi:SurA N-terminal domain-containing protein [Pelagicoccus sp. SDUM812002]|uniref:peptidylprolyl isomerase n=1 Tax=Pelagicoccus sp. SDUM812002 TaxID=3041266 RepID=UPI00280DF698|nr:SurA N-terminal domain-containing protein [Pelagicoccus sp. SDUM812002]MDQ8185433.1 SurA N-terminal domain-containing protein [Pelagicoccus sp. SDUM812002]